MERFGWETFESVALADKANFVGLCTFVKRFFYCGAPIMENCEEDKGHVCGPDFRVNLMPSKSNGTLPWQSAWPGFSVSGFLRHFVRLMPSMDSRLSGRNISSVSTGAGTGAELIENYGKLLNWWTSPEMS